MARDFDVLLTPTAASASADFQNWRLRRENLTQLSKMTFRRYLPTLQFLGPVRTSYLRGTYVSTAALVFIDIAQ